ncbi:BQ5605_C001g00096 [Microbotryum silenes-dioicae]|uniref:BQ5605_C001g00096 protein n=1 Tax=Microbotryum silenes-dioicae TaxID=796604 RepID=A0A2X0P595_9BASI|nr:BQ5605_C001g00096 [Microbotryum silenes-dioicae]
MSCGRWCGGVTPPASDLVTGVLDLIAYLGIALKHKGFQVLPIAVQGDSHSCGPACISVVKEELLRLEPFDPRHSKMLRLRQFNRIAQQILQEADEDDDGDIEMYSLDVLESYQDNTSELDDKDFPPLPSLRASTSSSPSPPTSPSASPSTPPSNAAAVVTARNLCADWSSVFGNTANTAFDVALPRRPLRAQPSIPLPPTVASAPVAKLRGDWSRLFGTPTMPVVVQHLSHLVWISTVRYQVRALGLGFIGIRDWERRGGWVGGIGCQVEFIELGPMLSLTGSLVLACPSALYPVSCGPSHPVQVALPRSRLQHSTSREWSCHPKYPVDESEMRERRGSRAEARTQSAMDDAAKALELQEKLTWYTREIEEACPGSKVSSTNLRVVICGACRKHIRVKGSFQPSRFRDHLKGASCRTNRLTTPTCLDYLTRTSAPGGGASRRRDLIIQVYPAKKVEKNILLDKDEGTQVNLHERDVLEWRNDHVLQCVKSRTCLGAAGYSPIFGLRANPCKECLKAAGNLLPLYI